MDFKYPYTDFHELNLDWFLAEFKKYYEKTIQQDEKIRSLDETVQQFTSFVTNYFDNLDVQQEINNKLNAMADDGTLLELIQPYYDQIVASQNQRIGTLETTAISLQNQINQIVAPDPDPTLAEVATARVGVDGTVYPSLKARCDTDMNIAGLYNETSLIYNATKSATGATATEWFTNIISELSTDVYCAVTAVTNVESDLSCYAHVRVRYTDSTNEITDIYGLNSLNKVVINPEKTVSAFDLICRRSSTTPSEPATSTWTVVFTSGNKAGVLADNINVLNAQHQYDFCTLSLSGVYPYIDYDNTSGTITIPGGMTYIDYNADGNKHYHRISWDPTVLSNAIASVQGTASLMLLLDITTWEFSIQYMLIAIPANKRLVAIINLTTTDRAIGSIMSPTPWSIDGYPYGIKFVQTAGAHVKGINHRGWHEAPEDTLPAYMMSRVKGFNYVETDVNFTSDGVAVLIHDDTINRTARNDDGTEIENTIYINSITYAQALQYDFGIYKGSRYAGTRIPTFADFIQLCRKIGLHPYIEIKASLTLSEAQVHGLVDIVNRNGMRGNVTWISFSLTYLGYVRDYDDTARLGYVMNTITQTDVDNAITLRSGKNEVFIDSGYGVSTEKIELCADSRVPLEVWTVDSALTINGLDPYITGVTSDEVVAEKVLIDQNIKNIYLL